MVIDDTADPPILHMPSIVKACLWPTPISNDGTKNNDNYLVVAVGFDHILYLCRLGDQSWTRQHVFSKPERFCYRQKLFYNGSIVAKENSGNKYIRILESAKIHCLPLPMLPMFGYYDDDDGP